MGELEQATQEALTRVRAAVTAGTLAVPVPAGLQICEGAEKAWGEVVAALAGAEPPWHADRASLLGPLGRLYKRLASALQALPDLAEEPPDEWPQLGSGCMEAAARAAKLVETRLAEAPAIGNRTQELRAEARELLASGFLEVVGGAYDSLLWWAEDWEWRELGSTGLVRLHMLEALVAAAEPGEAISRGPLAAGGLLELAGGAVQTAVSLASFALWCKQADFSLQLAMSQGLVYLTTADAAFLGASGGKEGSAETQIAKLTKQLNRHVNGLIQALIDYQVVDSFTACAERYRCAPEKTAPLVRALLTTIHNCLLYCSEHQKQLRMHLAMHSELVPNVLIPYVVEVLLPAVEKSKHGSLGDGGQMVAGAHAHHCLLAALQTFVVVTFNVGILRDRFRASDLVPRVLAACKGAGLLGDVSWLEVLVKLSVNVDLTLSPWRADWRQRLLDAVASLPAESLGRLRRRLASGGAGALPFSRGVQTAMRELTPVFGTGGGGGAAVAAAAAAGPSRRPRAGRRGRKPRGRGGGGRRRRWVPRFGLQDAAVEADAEDASVGSAAASGDGPGGEDSDGDTDTEADAAEEAVAPGSSAGGGAEEAEQGADAEDGAGANLAAMSCALTGALLRDPLVTPDGRHYERAALEDWLASAGPTDPVSGAPLELSMCREDPVLREAACTAQLAALSADVLHSVKTADEVADSPPGGAGAGPLADRGGRRLLGDLPPLAAADRGSAGGEAAKDKARLRRSRVATAEAPKRLRCAIDGKVMVEPVRSPYGHRFERKTLERWVASCGSVCPITSKPLRLEDCEADAELCEELLRFHREHPRRRGRQGA